MAKLKKVAKVIVYDELTGDGGDRDHGEEGIHRKLHFCLMFNVLFSMLDLLELKTSNVDFMRRSEAKIEWISSK